MNTRNWFVTSLVCSLAVCIARPSFGQVQVGVGVKIGKTEVDVAVDSGADDEPEPPPITVESFHEPLEPYGRWVETVRYGWVWHPDNMPPDWRPYSYGHWECTEMGWMFVSEHPWGWACYHYGRWLDTPDNGWIWVPGTVWAPAWVAWRMGGEHVGWAPLPPDPHYHHASTVIVEEKSFHLDFVFVHGTRFHEPCRPAVFVPPSQQVNIINQTTNITQVNVVNNTVINNGPQITQIQKISNKNVNIVKVKDVQKTEINNYHQDVAKTSPDKAAKLSSATSAVEKHTNSKVSKVHESSPEVRQRAAMAAPSKSEPPLTKPRPNESHEPSKQAERTPARPGPGTKPEIAGQPGTRGPSQNPGEPKPPVIQDAKRTSGKGPAETGTDLTPGIRGNERPGQPGTKPATKPTAPGTSLSGAGSASSKSKSTNPPSDSSRMPAEPSKSARTSTRPETGPQPAKKEQSRPLTPEEQRRKEKEKEKQKAQEPPQN